MLIHHIGNVFDQNLDVVCHLANCQGVMGGQVSKEVRQKYPKAYKADIYYKIPFGRGRLGLYSYAKVKHLNGHKFMICNLYGQEDFKGTSKQLSIKHFRKALMFLFNNLSKQGNFETLKIGVPYLIGCGGAKGDWREVSKVLEEVSNLYKKDIYIYEFVPDK